MTKHILIPTDFSEASYRAALFVLKIYRAIAGRFTLLYVHDPASDGREAADKLKKAHEDIDRFAERLLDALPEEGRPGIKRTVIKGIAVQRINHHAAQIEADLIVMGTTGASGFKRAFIGSVASRVIKRAPCAVLAVPYQMEVHSIDRIGFATDLKADDRKETYAPAFDLLDAHGSELFLLQVIDDMEEYEMEVIYGKDSMREHIKDRPHRYIKAQDSNVIKAIEGMVKTHGIDLLVMLKHHEVLNGVWPKSTVEKVAMRIDIPLLSLHQEPKPH